MLDAEESHRTKGLLRLTMACNERCPFCNVPMEDYPQRHTPEPELRAQIAAFAEGAERTLTISGGEPTLLRERLLWAVREARASGIELVELQTNAVLIDEGYARDLKEAGLTSAFVSLLSSVASEHDTLAGLDGAFAPCLRGIDALLDAGVRVTLNPVFASLTQERVPDYVRFVAERLPRVRSISLSAVQPHGRAAKALSLLPDYAVLGAAVKEAQARAAELGIELLNPYCGLPLCVGWEQALDRSVEAIEARAAPSLAQAPGVDNRGDKRHGPQCGRCVLRARCGGAWHAYWDERGGSGIAPPREHFDPFSGEAPSAMEAVVDAPRLETQTLEDLARATQPTVWLRLGALAEGDGARLADSACTHLALALRPDDLRPGALAFEELQILDRSRRALPPQRHVRVCLGLRPAGLRAVHRAVFAASAVGVSQLLILSRDAQRWEPLLRALREELPALELARVEP